METLVELIPNRKLLCPDFNGYHLTLDPLPVNRLNLQSGVYRVDPNEDQYSFLHAKVFGFHNHLFGDPWCPGTVYYFDSNWSIQGTVEEFGRVAAFKRFWDVPKAECQSAGQYNLSLSFPSFDMCVVSDGAGNLILLNTGDRTRATDDWQVIFSSRIPNTGAGFVLLDSRLIPDDAMVGEKIQPEEVHCLVLEVEEKVDTKPAQRQPNDEDSRSRSKFISTVNWVTLAIENDNWSVKSVVALSGVGGVDYAAIEEGCTAVYLAGNKPFDFNSKLEQNAKTSQDEKSKEEEIPCPFSWIQTADDITVNINAPASTTKTDVTVTVTAMYMSVSVKGEILLDGFLQNRVVAQLTTWSIKNDTIEVILSKEEEGLSWRSLIRGDPRGEILDPAYVEEVHKKLAHLCSETEETGSSGATSGVSSQQLEECDEVPANTSVLQRLDLNTRKVTHKASLSGHQWLFNSRVLGAQVPPAVCLRNDVDACVWQPEKLVESTEIWPIRHVGTFHAFGYVQASKQERKFTVCSPDMSYVSVCETSRHVYVYRQPGDFGGDLRCRSTGEKVKKIARQQLVQLDAGSHVLGCHAACENMFVLTTTTLYVIGTS